MKKKDFLKKEIKHIDIKKFNTVELIEQYSNSAFQARTLSNAAKIYEKMLLDKDCTIFLCLAGSLFSAGLKKVVFDMIENNMVDLIISSGAIIVDQDFFEALGFKHYIGSPRVDDNILYKSRIDRIYDTFIDEDQLRICDMTIKKIADTLPVKPYSSREFIINMGKYLEENKLKDRKSSVLWIDYKCLFSSQGILLDKCNHLIVNCYVRSIT